MRAKASRSGYDVVIVGGAVTGSAAAYFLASNPDFKGSVLVVERDWSYARSATALSLASIRHQFSDPINIRISQFGTSFIRQAGVHLSVDGSAPDLQFQENGYLFLARSGHQEQLLRQRHITQKACGADVALLEGPALALRFPWIRPDGIGIASLGQSGEGWFDNMGLLNALRVKACSLGVEYVEAEVTAVSCAANAVHSVALDNAQSIGCGQLVNAAGTRAAAVARLAGLDLPVEARRRCVFVISCPRPLPGKIPLTIDVSGVYFRPEGRYYLTGANPEDDPAVDVDDFTVLHQQFEELIWPSLYARVPAFEAIKLVNAWAGHYDWCVLDHNAIVGPHHQLRNFHFANGFSGHGLQQAPAIGRGLSELIIYGQYRSLDLSPLCYERVVENRPLPEAAVI